MSPDDIKNTKLETLAILERAKPACVSGGYIARVLGVTRAAVWKSAQALRECGYSVEAVTNAGYRLVSGPDTLYAEGIRQWLPESCRRNQIIVHQSTISTNDEARRLAVNGAAHGTFVAADTQTGGRGRYSRSFFSPPGTGLYMSVILRPEPNSGDVPLITVAAAVAVCRAIRGLTDFSPVVKWVNDVFVDGKKVCGILSEATSGVEDGVVSSVVTGIGINVSSQEADFPAELRGAAGSLYPDGNCKITRNALAAAVYAELISICVGGGLSGREFIDEYRSLSFVVGKEISYTRGAESGTGTAVDVDRDGRLLVRLTPGGEIIALNSGEVSIRPN